MRSKRWKQLRRKIRNGKIGKARVLHPTKYHGLSIILKYPHVPFHIHDHTFIFTTKVRIFLSMLCLPPTKKPHIWMAEHQSMVLSTPSCCRTSAGCWSNPWVLTHFSPGLLLFSPEDSCLSLFGFIIHRHQLPTPGYLDSSRSSLPCPFLCCLNYFFPIIALNPPNWYPL